MKTFTEYDQPDTLDESFLRGASAIAIMSFINTQRRKIKQSKKVDKKTIDALASMILASASLTFAMTQLPPEQLKGKK
jgi:hypothetical protein